jgi:hypothetical protein
MAFTLRKVINGEVKLFSIKNLLKIHGSKENDEILLEGEAYRISSFNELGGSGSGSTQWVKYDIIVETNGQNSFVLSESIIDTSSVTITINGVSYQLQKDNAFNLNSRTLLWNGIQIQYRKTI